VLLPDFSNVPDVMRRLLFVVDVIVGTNIVLSLVQVKPGAKASGEPTASTHIPERANTIMPSASGAIERVNQKK
jgi:hypothetical protein